MTTKKEKTNFFDSFEPSELNSPYDVAIIGAGPIGLELAVCFKRAGVNYLHLEAKQIGYTMTWWPRNTNFFSTTERLALAGIPIQNSHQQRITGEDYLVYLRNIVEQFDLEIHNYEPVKEIQKNEDLFALKTQTLAGESKIYLSRRIVLAVGDMTFPNRIHIPGEDLPHVTHYFRDPHDYFRKRLFIIGGKNTAVETALRCWRAGAKVTLSYRGEHLSDRSVKRWLLPDFHTQVKAGNITFLPKTLPLEITSKYVSLAPIEDGEAIKEKQEQYETDFVLLATGFRGDQSLLEMIGVELQGENRVPIFEEKTMESNVSGVYLAGTVAAGIQQRYTLFIENCHVHVGRIFAAVTGCWPEKLGAIPARTYSLPLREIEAN